MTRIENEIKIIVREEHKYEFEVMENEILKLKLENTRLKNEKEQYKKRIEELIKIKDLNSRKLKK